MRAGLAFVLLSLLLGTAFREWKRANEVRFADLVRELETDGEGRASGALDRPAGATGAESQGDPSGMPRQGASHSRRATEAALRPHGIDVNRASISELERLPGIGPSLAARIVAERERNGPYEGAEALLRVPGIGPRKLDLIRPYLAKEHAPADSGSPIAN